MGKSHGGSLRESLISATILNEKEVKYLITWLLWPWPFSRLPTNLMKSHEMHPIQFHEVKLCRNYYQKLCRNYCQNYYQVFGIWFSSWKCFRLEFGTEKLETLADQRPCTPSLVINNSLLLTWPWYLMQNFAISHEIHVLEKMLRKIEWNWMHFCARWER